MWWGGAARRRAPSSIPVGYASQTGYQYDSISRVAGQRELAPPSKFSNEGGFRNSVFRGIYMSSSLPLDRARHEACQSDPAVLNLTHPQSFSRAMHPLLNLSQRSHQGQFHANHRESCIECVHIPFAFLDKRL